MGQSPEKHGIGVEKMDYMPLIFSPADMQVMVTVKEVFNPTGLCNPGKIFPTAESYAKLGLPHDAAGNFYSKVQKYVDS